MEILKMNGMQQLLLVFGRGGPGDLLNGRVKSALTVKANFLPYAFYAEIIGMSIFQDPFSFPNA